MKMKKIADLHCDLLVYLNGDNRRTAHDTCCRCAIPQLRAGNVHLQILPAYVVTGSESSQAGMSQADVFEKLPEMYPDTFEIIRKKDRASETNDKIGIMLAFENAAGLCSEGESLDEAWNRLNDLEKRSIKVAYISMTWNEENRFGGGALTMVGLKKDGERLLDFLHERNTAIDLSHTSDPLADQILDYITKKNLHIPIIASHSNFRTVTNVPRNLPDFIAKEIIHRGGVIGMNFVKPFVGPESTDNFIRQLEYGLGLGAEEQLCLGADFFYVGDVPPASQKKPEDYFFSTHGDASCYPSVVNMWQNALQVSDELLDQITHSNLQQFLQTQIFA